jgi:hypothetical protein
MISLNCATPGAVQNPNLNWLPDKTGNLFITNETGTDIDVYMNGNYIRSIGTGAMNFAVDIPVSTVYGEACVMRVHGRANGALITVFEAVLYPSSMQEYRLPLFVRTGGGASL